MESIPFVLDLGLSTVQGVLRLERTDLVIEWRRYDMFESPQGDLQSLRVPYSRLERVEFQRRAVASRLVIHADGASAFSTLPLPAGEITTLRATIKRKHRSDAPGWAAEAGLRIAEAEEPGMIADS
ncbi:MAG: hypothetical protein EA382_01055 [Spirochaetaceae bacterium]|nr:MAG: hypothetical protein EA382_01055 [Spirochaetaceae bacterium]